MVLPPDDAITEDEAQILADASGHTLWKAYVTDGVCDGYFTIESSGRAALQAVRGEQVTMYDCQAHQFLNSPDKISFHIRLHRPTSVPTINI